MLALLLRLRRLTRRLSIGVAVLLIVTVIVRFVVLTPAPAPRWMETFVFPIISTIAILYAWVEAAAAGVDPESIFHVPDAPAFAWTMFALVGQMALWQSLGDVAFMFGLEGDAWIARKLDIAQAGLAIGGSIMLVEAWWERHATHPLAPWRRLLAAGGGLLALLLAMPWEAHVPIAVAGHKLWLYGGLAGGVIAGLVMGWRPHYSTPEVQRNG